jgi:hypothetical protein
MPGSGDAVILAVECHALLAPQSAQHRDLFVRALATVAEILPEGFEFDGVPAHADTEP